MLVREGGNEDELLERSGLDASASWSRGNAVEWGLGGRICAVMGFVDAVTSHAVWAAVKNGRVYGILMLVSKCFRGLGTGTSYLEL